MSFFLKQKESYQVIYKLSIIATHIAAGVQFAFCAKLTVIVVSCAVRLQAAQVS